MIRCVVIDDEALARQHLKSLLGAYADCQVAGEAASGLEALERIADCQPNVVFLDIGMPTLDGHETARRIRQPSATPVS